MKKVVKVSTDSTIEILDLDAPVGSLAVLQAAVDGYVQAVDLNESMTLWCNEEGKMVGLPRNDFATRMWEKRFGATDIIVGNAVFTGGVNEEGKTLGLTDEQIAWFEFVTS
jgi:hypothetical protein